MLGEDYVHSPSQVEPMLLSSYICLPEFLYRTYVAVGEEGTSIIKAKILGPCHLSNTSDYCEPCGFNFVFEFGSLFIRLVSVCHHTHGVFVPTYKISRVLLLKSPRRWTCLFLLEDSLTLWL